MFLPKATPPDGPVEETGKLSDNSLSSNYAKNSAGCHRLARLHPVLQSTTVPDLPYIKQTASPSLHPIDESGQLEQAPKKNNKTPASLPVANEKDTADSPVPASEIAATALDSLASSCNTSDPPSVLDYA